MADKIQLTAQGSLDSTPYLNYFLGEQAKAEASQKAIQNQLIREGTDYLSKFSMSDLDGRDLPGVMNAYDAVKNAYSTYATAFSGDNTNAKAKAYEQLTAAKSRLINLIGMAKDLKATRADIAKAAVEAGSGKRLLDVNKLQDASFMVSKPADEILDVVSRGEFKIPRVADFEYADNPKIINTHLAGVSLVTKDKNYVQSQPLEPSMQDGKPKVDAQGNRLYTVKNTVNDAGLNKIDELSIASYRGNPYQYDKMYADLNDPNQVNTARHEQLMTAAQLFQKRYNRPAMNGQDLAVGVGLIPVSTDGNVGVISVTERPELKGELMRASITAKKASTERTRVATRIASEKAAGEPPIDFFGDVMTQIEGSTTAQGDKKYLSFNLAPKRVRETLMADIRKSNPGVTIGQGDVVIRKSPDGKKIEIAPSSADKDFKGIEYDQTSFNEMLQPTAKQKTAIRQGGTTTAVKKEQPKEQVFEIKGTSYKKSDLLKMYTEDQINQAIKLGTVKVKK